VEKEVKEAEKPNVQIDEEKLKKMFEKEKLTIIKPKV